MGQGYYRILRNKRIPLVEGPGDDLCPQKMAISPLIIGRFSIRNPHWKAQQSFCQVTNTPANAPSHLLYAEYGIHSKASFSVDYLSMAVKQSH